MIKIVYKTIPNGVKKFLVKSVIQSVNQSVSQSVTDHRVYYVNTGS